MITDGKKWHYLAVKKLSVLFKGITSKHEKIMKMYAKIMIIVI